MTAPPYSTPCLFHAWPRLFVLPAPVEEGGGWNCREGAKKGAWWASWNKSSYLDCIIIAQLHKAKMPKHLCRLCGVASSLPVVPSLDCRQGKREKGPRGCRRHLFHACMCFMHFFPGKVFKKDRAYVYTWYVSAAVGLARTLLRCSAKTRARRVLAFLLSQSLMQQAFFTHFFLMPPCPFPPQQ